MNALNMATQVRFQEIFPITPRDRAYKVLLLQVGFVMSLEKDWLVELLFTSQLALIFGLFVVHMMILQLPKRKKLLGAKLTSEVSCVA